MKSPARLLIVAGYLMLAACNLWPARIHPEFVTTFVDVNRHADDDATGVAFDPIHRVLAVGRESGRLELWDASQPNTRVIVDAHSLRTADIVIGSTDGIVLTSSGFDQRSRVWDIKTGKLVHEIEDAMGPAALSPVDGLYVVANDSNLLLYLHAQRKVLGEPLKIGGGATAIASDRASGLVAVGTASGTIHLLKLEGTGESRKLVLLREVQPYEVGTWLKALTFLDNGTRLFSVNVRPGEVAEWDTATMKRLRVLPSTLRSVHWASAQPNEPWLLLAGEMGPDGERGGKVELIDLRRGEALRYKANTTHPVAVILPEITTGLVLQHASVRKIRYIYE